MIKKKKMGQDTHTLAFHWNASQVIEDGASLLSQKGIFFQVRGQIEIKCLSSFAGFRRQRVESRRETSE